MNLNDFLISVTIINFEYLFVQQIAKINYYY